MPRSNDGRWTRQCQVCGTEYQQRKPSQVTCSVACRAKLPHNTGGRRVKRGLERRACSVCNKEYQPAREKQAFCSAECYQNSPVITETRRRANRNRQRIDLQPRECISCGAEFMPRREAQVTCSMACYRRSPAAREHRTQFYERRRNDPDRAARVREYNRAEQLRRRYGMTMEEHDAKLAAQGGVCMICGQPPSPDGVKAASRLHMDHDHETGRNRDLICLNCNRGLGYFKDDPKLLRAAADYIERHRAA